jgi:hypothetical protein
MADRHREEQVKTATRSVASMAAGCAMLSHGLAGQKGR